MQRPEPGKAGLPSQQKSGNGNVFREAAKSTLKMFGKAKPKPMTLVAAKVVTQLEVAKKAKGTASAKSALHDLKQTGSYSAALSKLDAKINAMNSGTGDLSRDDFIFQSKSGRVIRNQPVTLDVGRGKSIGVNRLPTALTSAGIFRTENGNATGDNAYNITDTTLAVAGEVYAKKYGIDCVQTECMTAETTQDQARSIGQALGERMRNNGTQSIGVNFMMTASSNISNGDPPHVVPVALRQSEGELSVVVADTFTMTEGGEKVSGFRAKEGYD